jgi:uncharacterized protein
LLNPLNTLNTRGRYIIAYPPLLLAAWIAAWALNIALRGRLQWDVGTDTIYWIVMKVLVWILPAVLAIRLIERADVAEFMEARPQDAPRGLRWGLLVGLALVVVSYVGKTLPSGTPPRALTLDLVLLNAVVVAPLVEEITLRGFFLKRLELNGRGFWSANILTTLVFVLMHVPGWLFKGRFPSMVSLVLAMGPLAVLSLLLGWTKKRSKSLYGPIVLHAINNLYSAVFP